MDFHPLFRALISLASFLANFAANNLIQIFYPIAQAVISNLLERLIKSVFSRFF